MIINSIKVIKPICEKCTVFLPNTPMLALKEQTAMSWRQLHGKDPRGVPGSQKWSPANSKKMDISVT